MTALVSGALVLATATPASAAAPTRESTRDTFLSLSSTGCMTEEGPCMGVFAGESEGAGFVCVDLPDVRGNFSGCTETGPETLSITKTAQTIEPTRVEVARVECKVEDEPCEVLDSRTVTVSATAVTTGRLSKSVFRSRERTEQCRSTSSFRRRSAPVTGTLTVDGRPYSLTGEAGTSRSRFAFRGCDFGSF